MTKEIILDYLKEHKYELTQKYQVNKIALFGSYARDEATKDSDIDILVDMPSSFNNFFDLKYFLEKEFKKTVDLGTVNSLRAFIGNRIQKDIIYV